MAPDGRRQSGPAPELRPGPPVAHPSRLGHRAVDNSPPFGRRLAASPAADTTALMTAVPNRVRCA